MQNLPHPRKKPCHFFRFSPVLFLISAASPFPEYLSSATRESPEAHWNAPAGKNPLKTMGPPNKHSAHGYGCFL